MHQDKSLEPEAWVKNHADYLYAFAVRRISDSETCKDLIQDTFISGLKNRGSFQGKSSERTWLVAILKNKIIDYHRKNAGNKTISHSINELNPDNFFEDNGHWKPEYSPREIAYDEADSIENKEFGEMLKLCMGKMPYLWLSVFTMKHLDDEDSENICKELNLSPSNFWVIMHRAKLSLRACVEKNWVGR